MTACILSDVLADRQPDRVRDGSEKYFARRARRGHGCAFVKLASDLHVLDFRAVRHVVLSTKAHTKANPNSSAFSVWLNRVSTTVFVYPSFYRICCVTVNDLLRGGNPGSQGQLVVRSLPNCGCLHAFLCYFPI